MSEEAKKFLVDILQAIDLIEDFSAETISFLHIKKT